MRILLSTAFIFFVIHSTSFGQSQTDQRFRDMVLREVNVMEQRLQLDSAQKDKISIILIEYYENAQVNNANKEQMKSANDIKNERIYKILTPKQVVVFKEDMKAIKRKMDVREQEAKSKQHGVKISPSSIQHPRGQ